MVKKTCYENLKKEVKIWFYDRHFENNRWKTNLEYFENAHFGTIKYYAKLRDEGNQTFYELTTV